MSISGLAPSAEGSAPRARGASVLFVCTGNICRSPAGALVLNSVGICGVESHSAGTEAVVGSDINKPMARLLEGDGIDASEFRAQQLNAALIERSDLIVTATRDHRRAVLREAPGALRRTFTLRELAGLIELTEREGPLDALDLGTRLTQLAGLRGDRHPDSEDDIADPFGLSDESYLRAYQLISKAVRGPIARLLESSSL